MGKRYLIDSNIVIKSATVNTFDNKSILFLKTIIDESFNISVISKIELLSKDDLLLSFIETSNVLPLTDEIIELRRKHKIKIPDAIIAATALVHKFDLISNNVKDFSNIKGLNVIDP
jgi:predicted nucleic acid-binding protein